MDRETLIASILENTTALKRCIHVRMQSVMSDAPISQTQLELLYTISQLQPVSSKQLAAHLHLSRGAVSQLADALFQQHFITREFDTTDRRIQSLRLAQDGEDILHSLDKLRHQATEQVMRELTDAELRTWLRVQQKMIAAFHQGAKK